MVRYLATVTQQARSARARDPVYVGAQATKLKWMRSSNMLIHLCLFLPASRCVGMQKIVNPTPREPSLVLGHESPHDSDLFRRRLRSLRLKYAYGGFLNLWLRFRSFYTSALVPHTVLSLLVNWELTLCGGITF